MLESLKFSCKKLFRMKEEEKSSSTLPPFSGLDSSLAWLVSATAHTEAKLSRTVVRPWKGQREGIT